MEINYNNKDKFYSAKIECNICNNNLIEVINGENGLNIKNGKDKSCIEFIEGYNQVYINKKHLIEHVFICNKCYEICLKELIEKYMESKKNMINKLDENGKKHFNIDSFKKCLYKENMILDDMYIYDMIKNYINGIESDDKKINIFEHGLLYIDIEGNINVKCKHCS